MKQFLVPVISGLIALILAIFIGLGINLLWKIQGSFLDIPADPESNYPDSVSIFTWKDTLSPQEEIPAPITEIGFSNILMENKPWTSWKWDLLKIDKLTLFRELIRLKKEGFGGARIEFVNNSQKMPKPLAPILKFILDEASKQNFQLDLLLPLHTSGASGRALQQLFFGEAHVKGGKPVSIDLPEPRIPFSYFLHGWKERETVPQWREVRFSQSLTKLVSLVAIKPVSEKRSFSFWDLKDQTVLYADSIYYLDEFLKDGKLDWNPPPGYWKIIAIYQSPVSGVSPFFDQAFEINWFDSTVVADAFQLRMRALFQDSIKPVSLRSISFHQRPVVAQSFFIDSLRTGFAESFQYDLWPWLPALLVPEYNHPLVRSMQLDRNPEYGFSKVDKQIQHDVEEFYSDLFLHQYLQTQKNHVERLGLQSSFIPAAWKYNLPGAGEIPDMVLVDQGRGGASDACNKMFMSGALLAGKSIVMGQTMSYRPGNLGLASQEAKIGVDKLFAAGVNQIVFDLPKGNSPVNLAEIGYVPKWEAYPDKEITGQKKINDYVGRVQAWLQNGKSRIDVAVYLPFAGFPQDFLLRQDHEEIFFNGHIPLMNLMQNPDPPHNGIRKFLPVKTSDFSNWLESVSSLLDELEQQGLTWVWVNDELLERATVKENRIFFENSSCELVLLPDVPFMKAESAAQLAGFAQEGANILAYGKTATADGGFMYAEEKQLLVEEAMKSLPYRSPALDPEELRNLIEGLEVPHPVAFDDAYPFLRRHAKVWENEDEVHFFQNISYKGRVFQLEINGEFEHFYWVDADLGLIYPTELNSQGKIRGYLDAYSSMMLYAAHEPLEDSLLRAEPVIKMNPLDYQKIETLNLENWDMAITKRTRKQKPVTYVDTALLNWWLIDGLKDLTPEAYYVTNFENGKVIPDYRYMLDLGWVNASVEVRVNTQVVDTLHFFPYRLEITDYVQSGLNTIELWARSPQWQGLRKKVKRSKQEAAQEAPVGVLGPAKMYILDQ